MAESRRLDGSMDNETVDRTFCAGRPRGAGGVSDRRRTTSTLVSLAENVTLPGDRPPRWPGLRPSPAPAVAITRSTSWSPSAPGSAPWPRPASTCQMPMRDARRPGLRVPVTIPATGEKRFAGMARWTEGRLLSEVLRESDRQQSVAEESFRAARRHHRRRCTTRPAAWRAAGGVQRDTRWTADGLHGRWRRTGDRSGSIARSRPPNAGLLLDARQAPACRRSARAGAAARRLQHDPRRHASGQHRWSTATG